MNKLIENKLRSLVQKEIKSILKEDSNIEMEDDFYKIGDYFVDVLNSGNIWIYAKDKRTVLCKFTAKNIGVLNELSKKHKKN